GSREGSQLEQAGAAGTEPRRPAPAEGPRRSVSVSYADPRWRDSGGNRERNSQRAEPATRHASVRRHSRRYGFGETVTVAEIPRSGSGPRPSMCGRSATLDVPASAGAGKCTTNQPT